MKGFFSIKRPFSQMTLACVRMTKINQGKLCPNLTLLMNSTVSSPFSLRHFGDLGYSAVVKFIPGMLEDLTSIASIVETEHGAVCLKTHHC